MNRAIARPSRASEAKSDRISGLLLPDVGNDFSESSNPLSQQSSTSSTDGYFNLFDDFPLDGDFGEIAQDNIPMDMDNDQGSDSYSAAGDDTLILEAECDFEEHEELAFDVVKAQSVSPSKRKANVISEPSTPRRSKIPRTGIPTSMSLDAAKSGPSPPPMPLFRTDAIIISHSPTLQACMDKRNLPYGVQYEIWRLLSDDTIPISNSDIELSMLDKLQAKGTLNAVAAPSTAAIILRKDNLPYSTGIFSDAQRRERLAKSPWEELDREEAALRNDPYAALGFRQDNFYGGKVHFDAKLKNFAVGKEAPRYGLTLERAELGPSCRLYRRFGSKRFLRIKVPDRELNRANNKLTEYFNHPFILGPFVFRAFYAKDNNFFLVKTNETYDSERDRVLQHPSTQHDMSLLDFINWHNPLSQNKDQTMSKWASRFALGLSSSVPGCSLDPDNIVTIPDVCSAEGSDMTDGAGFINKAGIISIVKNVAVWNKIPVAIQCRIKGAKGLVILDSENLSDKPCISLRPSQIKISYPQSADLDPAHLTVDLLRASHAKTPSRLSMEVLINLAENGVPPSAFVSLIRQGLNRIIEPLTAWATAEPTPDVMRDLWSAVAKHGGVVQARLSREKAGLARIRGYADHDADVEDDEDDVNLDRALEDRSLAWWGDDVSGCPSTLEETVLYLLESGFSPQSLPVLREKLKAVVKSSVLSYVRACRIEIPMSATAFLIPDPTGLLEENEIFFLCSELLETVDGLGTHQYVGPAVLGRNPCKLPTDMRKVICVDRPELRHLSDVIVMSIKGSRRAADYLAGGDYDGDKGLLIFQPELVDPFVNADLKYSEEPVGIDANFERVNKKVTEFLEEHANDSEADMTNALQYYLLGALRDSSVVGMYSTFHDVCVYEKGYSHPESIRLAYMFCKCLDGAKTGLTVLKAVAQQDNQQYKREVPSWKQTGETNTSGNTKRLKRPASLGPFIMETIEKRAKQEQDRCLVDIEKIFQPIYDFDEDLAAPWKNGLKIAQRFEEVGSSRRQQDLNIIAQHVREQHLEHRQRLGIDAKPKRQKSVHFTSIPIEIRQDSLRALSKSFAERPLPSEVIMDESEIAMLRASYAYCYDHEVSSQKWSRYPWDVAMRELCQIKARKAGWGHKTVTAEFHQRMYVKQPRH